MAFHQKFEILGTIWQILTSDCWRLTSGNWRVSYRPDYQSLNLNLPGRDLAVSDVVLNRETGVAKEKSSASVHRMEKHVERFGTS